jgi:hypothetical protein
MNLVWPGPEYLPGYLAALQKGWSSDNVRGKAAADELRRGALETRSRLCHAGAQATAPRGRRGRSAIPHCADIAGQR